MATPPVRTERLVTFTDAVAAIALTLLVLPLVDAVPEEAREGSSLGEVVGDNLALGGAFLLSFVVIFRLWWGHHRAFDHLTSVDADVVRCSAVWTLAVVFLPVPTAVITSYAPSPATVALYGGTLVVASGAMTVLVVVARRRPHLARDDAGFPRETVLVNAATVTTMLLATVVGSLFATTVNYWAFLLMFLSGPVERLIDAVWRRLGRT